MLFCSSPSQKVSREGRARLAVHHFLSSFAIYTLAESRVVLSLVRVPRLQVGRLEHVIWWYHSHPAYGTQHLGGTGWGHRVSGGGEW